MAGARRPLKVRQKRWAIRSAAWLARREVEPRWISIGSFVAAAMGSAALVSITFARPWPYRSLLLLLAAVMMQLRLVGNLLDGMVAVEGNRKTTNGELYNDLPDRFSDWALFVAAGHAAAGVSIGRPGGVVLGWVAAMLAVLTAYTRVLGRSCGSKSHFAGPMAKQQRMALMCGACGIAACVTPWRWEGKILYLALILVIIGSIVTIARRLRLICSDLENAPR